MEYIFILLTLALLTASVQYFYKIRIYSSFSQMIFAVIIYLVVGISWDTYAIWQGHWIFPSDKILGPKIGLMPVEEYLFMLIIPYFILTVYNFLKRNKK